MKKEKIEGVKALYVRVPVSLYVELKRRTEKEAKTINEFVIDAIRDALKRGSSPEKEGE
jgi:predicted HicB family RNase H-like nuclease